MSLLMIHEAYMPVYMGSRFSLHRRAGSPEVVQEALADLKKKSGSGLIRVGYECRNMQLSISGYLIYAWVFPGKMGISCIIFFRR